MNAQISTKGMVGGIIGVLALVALIYYFVSKSGGAGSLEGQKPPGMPPGVASEFNSRMGGTPTGPGAPSMGNRPPGAPGGGAPGNMGTMTGPGSMGGR